MSALKLLWVAHQLFPFLPRNGCERVVGRFKQFVAKLSLSHHSLSRQNYHLIVEFGFGSRTTLRYGQSFLIPHPSSFLLGSPMLVDPHPNQQH